MARWVLALSLGIAAGAALACGGGEATDAVTDAPATDGGAGEGEDEEKDKELVIVPVDGDEGPHHCCAISEDGKERHQLARGPGECKNKLGGKWVEGSVCIPCCCKSPHDPDDLDKGYAYELTVPGTCAGVGDCVTDDVPECPQNRDEDAAEGGDDDEADKGKGKGKAQPDPKPRPRPRPSPGGGQGARPK